MSAIHAPLATQRGLRLPDDLCTLPIGVNPNTDVFPVSPNLRSFIDAIELRDFL
jgi:hypothetical protein